VSEGAAIAHPNIALVKYWGKRDRQLNLPAVPSLSLTLDGWHTETSIDIGHDRFVLNKKPVDDPRVFRLLDLLDPERPDFNVTSKNNFPTGAGLASSSSGFAALAVAGGAAFGRSDPAELSVLARRGSGSACRSIHGGFVEWRMGTRADGTDSHGVPVAPADHWNVAMVIAIVDPAPKAIGSTEGMERCRATSPLWGAWVEPAENDVAEARAAVLAKDIERLGTIMEQSTFRMFATMHTARPPLIYWKPGTIALLHAVLELRASGVGAWMTMDAGPQVKVLCERADVRAVERALEPHVRKGMLHVHGPGGPARATEWG
jgi:diphosphomevalonate decarboxylase